MLSDRTNDMTQIFCLRSGEGTEMEKGGSVFIKGEKLVVLIKSEPEIHYIRFYRGMWAFVKVHMSTVATIDPLSTNPVYIHRQRTAADMLLSRQKHKQQHGLHLYHRTLNILLGGS